MIGDEATMMLPRFFGFTFWVATLYDECLIRQEHVNALEEANGRC